MKKVTINKSQRLFVIPCGDGFTCLGFDVCDGKAQRLADELGEPFTPAYKGTLKGYDEYKNLIDLALKKYQKTGVKSKIDLHPQLVGLEHHRVEVVDADGETYRFEVGKSTGWIPCHLQLSNRASSGGGAVDSRPFKSVTVIRK